MTLFIASGTSAEAKVIIDSFVTVDSGPPVAGKCYSLGTQLAVLAGRGPSQTIEAVYLACNRCGAPFDYFTSVLSNIVADAIAQTPPDIKQMPGGGGFNLVIAGWSPMRGHPILFCYEEHPWGTPAEVRVVEPPCVVYQPNIEGAPLSPADVADPAVIMALARRQAAQLHQRYGEKSAGGILVEARVTRNGIAIRHLGDLDAAQREAAE